MLSTARSQAVLGVADQALSSGTNFAVMVVAATSLSKGAFGVFAVALLTYSILIGASQALIGQELSLAFGEEGEKRRHARDASLFSLALGVVVAIPVCVVGLVASGELGRTLLVLALALPGMFLQDTLRFAASVLDRIELSCASDFAWLVGAAAVWSLGSALGWRQSPAALLGYWAVAGCASATVSLGLLRGPLPRPQLGRFLTKSHLGYRFLLEFVFVRAISQSLQILIGFMAGVSAAGSLRGANTIFGPLGVAIQAVTGFGAPIVRRVAPSRRDPYLALVGVVLVAVIWGCTGLLLSLPDSAGTAILGETWAGARPLLLPIGAQAGFLAVSALVFLAIRVTSPTKSLTLRLVASSCVVPAFFIGYRMWGVTGATWGLVLGSIAQTLLGLVAYQRLRRSGRGLADVGAE